MSEDLMDRGRRAGGFSREERIAWAAKKKSEAKAMGDKKYIKKTSSLFREKIKRDLERMNRREGE